MDGSGTVFRSFGGGGGGNSQALPLTETNSNPNLLSSTPPANQLISRPLERFGNPGDDYTKSTQSSLGESTQLTLRC